MKENRFQRILREGGAPAGHMIMEFGTRGIARILDAAGVGLENLQRIAA